MLLKTMAIILLIDVCISLLKNKFVGSENKNVQDLCADLICTLVIKIMIQNINHPVHSVGTEANLS
jgi:hypothetical protein